MKTALLHLPACFGMACLLALLFLTCNFPSAAVADSGSEHAPPPWVVECVDCPHFFSDLTPQAAQIDSQGVIHVVYGGEALYHAWLSAAGWQVEVADPVAGVGRYAALAVGPGDSLHVVYFDDNSKTLRYAVREAGAWHNESLDATIFESNPYPTIGVDSSGRPHVAFYRPSEGDLYYLVRTGAGWQKELVDSAGDVGQYASLAVDSAGNPHIAYYDATNGDLRYAVKQNGAWALNVVDSEDNAGAQASLVLDSQGGAHIAALRSSTTFGAVQIVYYTGSAGAWQAETVTPDCSKSDNPGYSTVACGLHIVLRLDAAGNPRLVYYNLNGSIAPYPYTVTPQLRYAERGASGWSIEKLEEAYADPLLVIDVGGASHYLAVGRMQLADRIRGPAGWQATPIDQGGEPGLMPSLAVDRTNRVHVSAYDPGRDEYRYALRAGATWAFTPLRPPGLRWAQSALAVDPAGYPRLLTAQQTHGIQCTYAVQDAAGWQTTGDWCDYPIDFALAIDNDSVSHLVLNWYGVQYRKGMDGPLPVKIDGSDSAMAMSLAVGSGRAPHVAYIDTAAGQLRYASVRAGKWFSETVTAIRPGGSGPNWSADLAVGPGDAPWIAYADAGIVWLATRTGGKWQRTAVEELPWLASPQVTLAVDGRGRAHVAYYDSTAGNLKYALVTPGELPAIVVVDSEGDVGQNPSIALDVYGQPHIAYYDATHRDLKQAFIPFTPASFGYLPVVSR